MGLVFERYCICGGGDILREPAFANVVRWPAANAGGGIGEGIASGELSIVIHAAIPNAHLPS